MAEHVDMRQMLDDIEVICNRRLSVQREKMKKIQKRLNSSDQELFSVNANVDIEAYILCAAAATRKYCTNENNLKVINAFKSTLILFIVGVLSYYFACYHYY